MRYFTAPLIFDGIQFLRENTLVAMDEEGVFCGYAEDLTCADVVDLKEGILCPGFINVHCHLELSHMHNSIARGIGMTSFLKQVVEYEVPHMDVIDDAIQKQDIAMYENGIQAVGDISNTTHTVDCKQKSKIYYHTFVEIYDKKGAAQDIEDGLSVLHAFRTRGGDNGSQSLVPHAPYSVSVALMENIAAQEGNNLLSIHYNESKDEVALMQGQRSEIQQFLAAQHQKYGFQLLPYNEWSKLLPSSVRLLLVHNTMAELSDIAYFSDQKQKRGLHPFYCLCPHANNYITRSTPPLDMLEAQNVDWCIGTDSLASNSFLSVWEEVKLLYSHYPQCSIEAFLKAATSVGARALGVDDLYGTFDVGKRCGLIHISSATDAYIDASSKALRIR